MKPGAASKPPRKGIFKQTGTEPDLSMRMPPALSEKQGPVWPSLLRPTTFKEIMSIGANRDLNRLESLSPIDLNVLFSYLNRQRVPLSEEEAFTRFYVAVFERIRSGRK